MWQPSISIEHLKQRAQILKKIRQFFDARGILEVETPLLCGAPVTDPFIEALTVMSSSNNEFSIGYLQTSPEYAMKRLLAAGSPSIFQICKAFRKDEVGRLHRPEFTMLEWYHLDYTDHELMDETDSLLQLVLNCPPAERLSYQEIFQQYYEFDPHSLDFTALKNKCEQVCGPIVGLTQASKDDYLMLLLNQIETQLGRPRPLFIYDFPSSQSALARLKQDNEVEPQRLVAARFEVYIEGMEIGNGYYELTEAKVQRRRFEEDLQKREMLKLPPVPIDEKLMAALHHGLPDCAGIAVGLDRLVMLALGVNDIQQAAMQY